MVIHELIFHENSNQILCTVQQPNFIFYINHRNSIPNYNCIIIYISLMLIF